MMREADQGLDAAQGRTLMLTQGLTSLGGRMGCQTGSHQPSTLMALLTIMMASCRDRSVSSINCSAPPRRMMVQVLALGQPVKKLYLCPGSNHTVQVLSSCPLPACWALTSPSLPTGSSCSSLSHCGSPIPPFKTSWQCLKPCNWDTKDSRVTL